MHFRTAGTGIGGRSFALSLIFLLAATSPRAVIRVATDGLSDAERMAISSVSGEAIRRMTTDLSTRAMEGRGTAQSGGDRAAKYIADRFWILDFGFWIAGPAGCWRFAFGL